MRRQADDASPTVTVTVTETATAAACTPTGSDDTMDDDSDDGTNLLDHSTDDSTDPALTVADNASMNMARRRSTHSRRGVIDDDVQGILGRMGYKNSKRDSHTRGADNGAAKKHGGKDGPAPSSSSAAADSTTSAADVVATSATASTTPFVAAVTNTAAAPAGTTLAAQGTPVVLSSPSTFTCTGPALFVGDVCTATTSICWSVDAPSPPCSTLTLPQRVGIQLQRRRVHVVLPPFIALTLLRRLEPVQRVLHLLLEQDLPATVDGDDRACEQRVRPQRGSLLPVRDDMLQQRLHALQTLGLVSPPRLHSFRASSDLDSRSALPL